MKGFPRKDGRKGIRNVVVVAYLIECARHVANEIAVGFSDHDVHVIGFPGCYPNDYGFHMMSKLCTHPNVGAVLLVSLGCEGFNRGGLSRVIENSGRPVETLVIQETGGTTSSVAKGRVWVKNVCRYLDKQTLVDMEVGELVGRN